VARLPVDRTHVFPRVTRPVGTHTSPSRLIDSDQPGQWIELVMDMSDTVRQDPMTRLRFALQTSADDVTYADAAGITFSGHPIGTSASGAPEDLPGMQVGMDRFRGQFVRAQLMVENQATQVGFTIRAEA
jgi:hypothetical protein